MVTTSDRGRGGRDADRSNARADRAQVILIGAVALAFIILGVVVVFNGVVYTETLSSADTSQSASNAETTELEVRQGIACLIAEDEDGDPVQFSDGDLEGKVGKYGELYRNATANSQPAIVNIELKDDSIDLDAIIGDSVTVTITYDSNDLMYERDVEISAEECPS